MKPSKIFAIFLDRDGTIIEERSYPKDPEQVVLLSHSAQALHLMTRKGYTIFVVSNQSGVGRGIISRAEFEAVHQRCSELLQAHGAEIAEFAYCFHRPDDKCLCRKPLTGLIPESYRGKDVNWKRSFVVGDKRSDLELGDNIGATSYLVLTGWGPETLSGLEEQNRRGDYKICQDLLEVAKDLPVCPLME